VPGCEHSIRHLAGQREARTCKNAWSASRFSKKHEPRNAGNPAVCCGTCVTIDIPNTDPQPNSVVKTRGARPRASLLCTKKWCRRVRLVSRTSGGCWMQSEFKGIALNAGQHAAEHKVMEREHGVPVK
jgi:hypothetical protein